MQEEDSETLRGSTEGGVKQERETVVFLEKYAGAVSAMHEHAAGTNASSSSVPGETI